MIMLMEHTLIYVVLTLVGLCLGSFAAATVWRLRARQLVADKAAGEKVSEKELKTLLPLTKSTPTTDRSRCLHCGHTLAWYDLLPLASWATLGGKCRYCRKSIGTFEPLMEIGVAAFFVFSYFLWPEALVSTLQITHFVLWLVAGVLLAILFAYDMKWFLLPNYAVFPLIAVGVGIAGIQLLSSTDVLSSLINLFLAIGLLSGIYFLLWLISKGQWIGFGDIKLGLALALILGDWPLAFITLFAANLIGCIIVIPGLLTRKLTRKTHVPFGPLLILGALVAVFAGRFIMNWYVTAFM
jgi:prepilin signal peptidase PulO-like enzyme (type II secretory pathway)